MLFLVLGDLKNMFRFSPLLQQYLVSKIRKECSNFKALPDANGDVDQLRWWQAYQEQFPLLSYLVRVVFALPAASSKSERVFSVAGNMVTPKIEEPLGKE